MPFLKIRPEHRTQDTHRGGGMHLTLSHGQSLNIAATWVWLKIKELGPTADFSLGFHLPRCHCGTTFLSRSHMARFERERERERERESPTGWICLAKPHLTPGSGRVVIAIGCVCELAKGIVVVYSDPILVRQLRQALSNPPG